MPDNLLESQLTYCRRVSLLEARRRGLSLTDAEDIAQDVCIQLWAALLANTQIRCVGGWSRVAAGRLILNRQRDEHRAKRGGGNLRSLDELTDAGFEV